MTIRQMLIDKKITIGIPEAKAVSETTLIEQIAVEFGPEFDIFDTEEKLVPTKLLLELCNAIRIRMTEKSGIITLTQHLLGFLKNNSIPDDVALLAHKQLEDILTATGKSPGLPKFDPFPLDVKRVPEGILPQLEERILWLAQALQETDGASFAS